MRFIDEVEIRVVSGGGGAGAISFRHEKYVDQGGPDGGDGGRGGSVFLEVDAGLNTLAGFRGRRLYQAERGQRGDKRQMTGRSGKDLVLRVPQGTLVYDAATDALLADLAGHDARVEIARGGQGGRGNMRFATATNQAPRRADPGGSSEAFDLRLELKLLADVGVLGFPNAGKSTFVSRVSAARPRIADYPFTTLTPSLGVVDRGDEGSWVVADVPGLIEGAAQGAGLGHRFLKHVQRTRLLLHLVRVVPEEVGSPLERYRILRAELAAFDPELAARPELVALSQIDAVPPEELAAILASFQAAGVEAHALSAVTGHGLKPLLDLIWQRLQEPS
ncbi:MAG: GTPase ObgE [Pseudomonadota bacterium]